jgi:hypothetical protein
LCASSSAKAIRGAIGFFRGVILTTATGAGEATFQSGRPLAGPVVNNASALFKSLEITPLKTANRFSDPLFAELDARNSSG